MLVVQQQALTCNFAGLTRHFAALGRSRNPVITRCGQRIASYRHKNAAKSEVSAAMSIINASQTTSSTPTPSADALALFSGAMPKAEIGALRFLKEHPEYDGRGVIVAIFDTGVDPGVQGLQLTTDGKPKILDVLDCTGSGDVDTSKVVSAADGAIEGIFGNLLALNPEWKNPTGEWRVGSKRLYELIAGGLKRRLQTERKKRFAAEQRDAVTAATTALSAFQRAHESGSLSPAEDKENGDLAARLQLLKDLDGKWDDKGPMLDCVVWHDGDAWRAALDTSNMYASGAGKGLLADFAPMTNYKAERVHGTFSAEDACNFAINIYDDGAVLSIVVDAGSHGTHVAGITAAHHVDEPGLNGIAPGAQIISCKIGDSRLGSMETMTGLTRALIAVLEHKADLINMSYGESTATPNMGRFIELVNEVVYKHGVIFVSSAGNSGPALSTVGAPGGTSSAIISVGAYVSPDMALGSHSIREGIDQGQQYTWSSRGPTTDGHAGVTLSAPGGAIAPVPQWTQQARMLMNGTSMASPSACGGVALVLSGCKASHLAINPTSVRRALENTCQPLGGDSPDAILTYGRGLMQVDAAFKYMERWQQADKANVRLEVSVGRSDTQASARGIYLREPADTRAAVRFSVRVNPTFHEDADTKLERLPEEHKLRMSCSVPWVTAPPLLLLAGGMRSFEVEVDPTGLPEGLHYAEVTATDALAPQRGALFRIPVTVIKPLVVETSSAAAGGEAAGQGECIARLGAQKFSPGTEVRRFVAVPEGATWAELRLRAGPQDTPRMFLIRTTQLMPHSRFNDFEKSATASLSAHGTHATAFKVAGGGTLEITLSQFWSSLGESSLEADLEFHGVVAEPSSISLDGSAGNAKLWVRAPFRFETLAPAAKLDRLLMSVRPSEARLSPLTGARDALPDGRTAHALLLTYKFSLAEEGKLTPRLPMLNRYVYDGEMEQQMYMLFDGNKKLLAVGDIYPAPQQLPKGDAVLRLLLRHDSPALLEKFKTMPLVFEKQIEAVTVPIYPSNNASVKGEGAIKERYLAAGQRAALFVGPAPEEKLPKDAIPGRLLTGSLTLAKLSGAAGNGDAPGAPTITYVIPPKKEDEKKAVVKEDDVAGEKADLPARVAEAVREAKLTMLKEATDSEEEVSGYSALQRELLDDGGPVLPVLSERLQRLAKAHAKAGADHSNSAKDVEAADAVVAAIDTSGLAIFISQTCPEEGPAAAKRKKSFDEQKAALVEALAYKVRVLLDAEDVCSPDAAAASAEATAEKPAVLEGVGPSPEGEVIAEVTAEQSPVETAAAAATADVLEDTYGELRKWVDPAADVKYALLHARRLARAGLLAGALKALDKAASASEDGSVKDALECAKLRAVLFERLGWAHWSRQETSRIKDAFPPSYPLF